jgi:hypothetical protein
VCVGGLAFTDDSVLPAFPQSLSSTVTLEHSPLPPGVSISFESHCKGPEKTEGEAGDRGQCNDVRVNQTVSQPASQL